MISNSESEDDQIRRLRKRYDDSSPDSSPVKKKIRSFIGAFYRTRPPYTPPKVVTSKKGQRFSLFFTNKYVFSNHFPADFNVNGQLYTSSEQYYMYYKAKYFFDDEICFQILQTSCPKEMKRLGRRVLGFDEREWKKISVQVMERACYHKFYQNPLLRRELFLTSNTTLVEASSQDRFWGAGLSMDDEDISEPEKWKGQNILGQVLTTLRDAFQTTPEFIREWNVISKELETFR